MPCQRVTKHLQAALKPSAAQLPQVFSQSEQDTSQLWCVHWMKDDASGPAEVSFHGLQANNADLFNAGPLMSEAAPVRLCVIPALIGSSI